jgi:hypothetical protein
MPAATRRSSVSTLEDEGPIVQTIFVWRIARYSPRRSVENPAAARSTISRSPSLYRDFPGRAALRAMRQT